MMLFQSLLVKSYETVPEKIRVTASKVRAETLHVN